MSDLKERVSQALEEVRPSLQADGGDIRFVEITDENIVKVELQGACNGCPMAQMTLKQGVENYLRKVVPEISFSREYLKTSLSQVKSCSCRSSFFYPHLIHRINFDIPFLLMNLFLIIHRINMRVF